MIIIPGYARVDAGCAAAATTDATKKLMNKSLTVLEENKIIVQQVVFKIS